MPEIGREIAQHGERRRRTLGDLLRDAVQRIEQEMRIELQAQFLELGPERLGLGARGVPVLGLLRHLGMDPEVAEAPSGQRQPIVD